MKNYCTRIVGGMRRTVGDGDLNEILEIEILEAVWLVMARSRTLRWEAVKGKLLPQGQVNVVI